MKTQPSATSASRPPLLNYVFWYAIVPFLVFQSLVALVSETERYSRISHSIIGLGPQQFGLAMVFCIVGDIAVLGFLLDRFHHKRNFFDLAVILLCAVLAGLTLRGLYLACV